MHITNTTNSTYMCQIYTYIATYPYIHIYQVRICPPRWLSTIVMWWVEFWMVDSKAKSMGQVGPPSGVIVEQMIAYVRRIAQIMIQATDLAQILYRSHPLRKNAGHAKFQYGRHFPIWPPWALVKYFCIKMAAVSQKWVSW